MITGIHEARKLRIVAESASIRAIELAVILGGIIVYGEKIRDEIKTAEHHA